MGGKRHLRDTLNGDDQRQRPACRAIVLAGEHDGLVDRCQSRGDAWRLAVDRCRCRGRFAGSGNAGDHGANNGAARQIDSAAAAELCGEGVGRRLRRCGARCKGPRRRCCRGDNREDVGDLNGGNLHGDGVRLRLRVVCIAGGIDRIEAGEINRRIDPQCRFDQRLRGGDLRRAGPRAGNRCNQRGQRRHHRRAIGRRKRLGKGSAGRNVPRQNRAAAVKQWRQHDPAAAGQVVEIAGGVGAGKGFGGENAVVVGVDKGFAGCPDAIIVGVGEVLAIPNTIGVDIAEDQGVGDITVDHNAAAAKIIGDDQRRRCRARVGGGIGIASTRHSDGYRPRSRRGGREYGGVKARIVRIDSKRRDAAPRAGDIVGGKALRNFAEIKADRHCLAEQQRRGRTGNDQHRRGAIEDECRGGERAGIARKVGLARRQGKRAVGKILKQRRRQRETAVGSDRDRRRKRRRGRSGRRARQRQRGTGAGFRAREAGAGWHRRLSGIDETARHNGEGEGGGCCGIDGDRQRGGRRRDIAGNVGGARRDGGSAPSQRNVRGPVASGVGGRRPERRHTVEQLHSRASFSGAGNGQAAGLRRDPVAVRCTAVVGGGKRDHDGGGRRCGIDSDRQRGRRGRDIAGSVGGTRRDGGDADGQRHVE